jgi:hypothetical protein
VLDRGDEVYVGEHRVGTVLGFDACHFPNHYNILIATADVQSGRELGLEPEATIEFAGAR